MTQFITDLSQPSHPNPTHNPSGQGELNILKQFLGLPAKDTKDPEPPKKDQELLKKEKELVRRERELAKREKDQNDFKTLLTKMVENNRGQNNVGFNQQPAPNNDRPRNPNF